VLHDPIEISGEDYNTTICIRASFIGPPGGYGFGILARSKTLWAIFEEER
jgi:hypothetical protein